MISASIIAVPSPGLDGKYAFNTPVTLIAQTGSFYRFVQWLGDASGSNPYTTIIMNGNKSVTASFYEERFKLTTYVYLMSTT